MVLWFFNLNFLVIFLETKTNPNFLLRSNYFVSLIELLGFFSETEKSEFFFTIELLFYLNSNFSISQLWLLLILVHVPLRIFHWVLCFFTLIFLFNYSFFIHNDWTIDTIYFIIESYIVMNLFCSALQITWSNHECLKHQNSYISRSTSKRQLKIILALTFYNIPWPFSRCVYVLAQN